MSHRATSRRAGARSAEENIVYETDNFSAHKVPGAVEIRLKGDVHSVVVGRKSDLGGSPDLDGVKRVIARLERYPANVRKMYALGGSSTRAGKEISK